VDETTRLTAAVKAELLAQVSVTQVRTGWPMRRLLSAIGLIRARYRDWVKRAAGEELADRLPIARLTDGVLPEEKDAVLAYALRIRRMGVAASRGRWWTRMSPT
jgi:hypothetical protein